LLSIEVQYRRRIVKITKALIVLVSLALVASAPVVFAQLFGEGPRLDPLRPTQAEIEAGLYTFGELRTEGEIIFATPFNRYDGYGDGPINPLNTRDPGGRPHLGQQGPDGVTLRVNGLDSGSCLDCHGISSLRSIPGTFAVGGFGNISNQVIAAPTEIDIADLDLSGSAEHNGRFINPPFSFGAGGVELLAKEMTADLRAIAQQMWNAGYPHSRTLVSKGIYFGTLHLVSDLILDPDAEASASALPEPYPYPVPRLHFDFSDVVGLREPENLLVFPFGRKGTAFSIRDFDLGAMAFHFGMQPSENHPGVPDPDGDGVPDEILPGDLSMLTIFQAALARPFVERLNPTTLAGYITFIHTGCAYCHRPVLRTTHRQLPVSFPENRTLWDHGQIGNPFANAFFWVDLTVAGFRPNFFGGVNVPLFADLKLHDMGDELAETSDQTSAEGNRTFTTARLWGVCDTEPYLHDGRAFTLNEAIEAHGGEAAGIRDTYKYTLSEPEKNLLLQFLCSLRTPRVSPFVVAKAPPEAEAPQASEETDGEELLDIYDQETAGIALYQPPPGAK
jgi:hypothetical protein